MGVLVQTKRCTVLADARPGGRLPPLSRADLARMEPETTAARTRVGADVATDLVGRWPLWLPIVLAAVGGALGFGVSTLLAMRGRARAIAAIGGAVVGGAGTFAAMALPDLMRKKQ